MPGRKVRDENEARSILMDAESRNLEPGDVASERGVDRRSLQAWRMTLKRAGRVPEQAGMVELVTFPTAEPTVYRVLVGDMAVELDDQFQEGTLRRLLGVLRAC